MRCAGIIDGPNRDVCRAVWVDIGETPAVWRPVQAGAWHHLNREILPNRTGWQIAHNIVTGCGGEDEPFSVRRDVHFRAGEHSDHFGRSAAVNGDAPR